MATKKADRDFFLEQLQELPLSTKSMMGEYLIYYDDKLIGGLYDGRFLLKKTKTNEGFNLKEEIPYQGAKSMYFLDSEDKDFLKKVVTATFLGIKK